MMSTDNILIDDVVKGIIEGLVFIIPETVDMPKDNDQINVNGFTASLLKTGENVGCVKRVRDTGTKDVVFKISLSDESNKNCSLKFFVYNFSTIIDSNDMKVFGTPSKSIMEYIDTVIIDIKHKCHGRSSSYSQTCRCVTELKGCIIECKDVVHTVTKDILSDLVQNNLYDMRSFSCIPYTKHGSVVMRVIGNPQIIDQFKDDVKDSANNPDIISVDPQASDFVLRL